MELMNANAQWATRPADETFATLDAFTRAMTARKAASMAATVERDALHATAIGDEVCLVGKSGVPAPMTNWAFGQLAASAKAPAGYLRGLPAKLAAECIEVGLRQRTDDADSAARVLLRKDDDALRLHALTSEKYARIWNAELGTAVMRLQDRHPNWQNPEAFRTMTGRLTWGEPKTLPCAWGGDRDAFIFLCDYTKTVKVDGQDHPLARGFFLENSEVGAGAVRLTTFLFDMVCANLIVWGATDVKMVSMRHVGGVRDRFFGDGSALKALAAFADSSAREDELRIRRARETRIADTLDDARSAVLAKRIPGITGTTVSAAYEIAASEPRYGDPLSVWGLVNGITEYSQRTAYAGERTALDRAAGRLLEVTF